MDGEGRVYSAGGGSQLASTIYNTASQPTAVNFASGDSDSYIYDPNTGRMAQYNFNVNGQSEVGALTWNPIGTLKSLAITDPFNSANAQTCNYAHDDLARITSANCGSIWSQTFTYADAFGNLTKSGNSSFSASYSPTTNRMTTIGSSTPTYDANGNVTNDFLHTYTWNAYGRPVTIDGVGMTYDALGRAVELNNSGVHTETQYSPTGFKMQLLNGQTLVKDFLPLPAGAEEVWTPSANYYRHADWLGSARLTSNQNRTIYGDVAYAPFGETYAQSGTADASFTGMNQDTVSNEYDFPAREYGIQGRWPSPDPAGLGAVDPSNPQSWNRYAYVDNNPLAMTDPTGMEGYPCGDLISCIAINVIGGIFEFFLGHHHHHSPPPPQAPPAPQGGYGAGFDPFGGNAFLGGLIDIGCARAKVGNRGGPWGPWGCHVYINGVDVGTVGVALPSFAGPVAIALALPNGSPQLPYSDLFKPSCAGVYGEGFSNALGQVSLPFSGPAAPIGGSPEELAATGARAVANQYIVNRGLVVAMRSSIFRGLNFVADLTEAFPLAQFGYAGAGGDIALGKAKFVNHSCQMP